MPLGSSSEAPVIRPGPKNLEKLGPLGLLQVVRALQFVGGIVDNRARRTQVDPHIAVGSTAAGGVRSICVLRRLTGRNAECGDGSGGEVFMVLIPRVSDRSRGVERGSARTQTL